MWNLTNWFHSYLKAEIEGPVETPYESRFFQIKLVFGKDFPQSPPRGYFLTKIYHPNVDITTGAICVNTLKKDWNPSVSLGHVLSIIRCLLIVPFPESSLNDEAGKLFMDSYDEFFRRAKLMADVHGCIYSYTETEELHSPKNSINLMNTIETERKSKININATVSHSMNHGQSILSYDHKNSHNTISNDRTTTVDANRSCERIPGKKADKKKKKNLNRL